MINRREFARDIYIKPNPVDRMEAMRRWNLLRGKQRQDMTDFHYPGRNHTTLTGSEIQRMYNSN